MSKYRLNKILEQFGEKGVPLEITQDPFDNSTSFSIGLPEKEAFHVTASMLRQFAASELYIVSNMQLAKGPYDVLAELGCKTTAEYLATLGILNRTEKMIGRGYNDRQESIEKTLVIKSPNDIDKQIQLLGSFLSIYDRIARGIPSNSF